MRPASPRAGELWWLVRTKQELSCSRRSSCSRGPALLSHAAVERGDYERAETLLSKAKDAALAGADQLRLAIAIDEKALGPDHPNTRMLRADLERLKQAPADQKRAVTGQ